MSQILVLVRKSILNFSRARAAIVITFLVPIVLIYIFGHVFGLYRKDSGPLGIPLAIVNDSGDPSAQKLVDALKKEKALEVITASDRHGQKRPLTEADVRAGLHNNDYRFALILPANLVGGDDLALHLKFLTNPRNEIEAQTVSGIVQKTVFSSVPQLLGQALQKRSRELLGDARYHQFNRTMALGVSSTFGGDADAIQREMESGTFIPSAATQAAGTAGTKAGNADNPSDALSRLVKIESEQVAGKDVKSPMGARIVGGYAIMFLLFAVAGSAASMYEEKATGVFQRLLASPVTPAHIVWARFFWGMLLGLAQISALFIAGRVFFGLDIAPHAVALFAVAIAAAAACSSFGLFVTAVAPSAAAAQGLSTFVVISMSAIGGAWFPVSFMPSYIQAISKLTIVYWSVEGFTDVLWAGRSLVDVLPKVGILAGIATLVMAFSVWRFNRNKFFE